MGTWTQGCGRCAGGWPVRAPGVRCCVGHRLGPALSCPLSSPQGDRGFDGLAGLPGEKGHRVSVCCLGAAGSSCVRALWGSLRLPGGQTLDPRVVATCTSWGWGRTWTERPGDASSAHGGPVSPPPLTAKGPLGSVPQGARQREAASAQEPPHCQETQQLPLWGPAGTLRTIKGATPGRGPALHGLPRGWPPPVWPPPWTAVGWGLRLGSSDATQVPPADAPGSSVDGSCRPIFSDVNSLMFRHTLDLRAHVCVCGTHVCTHACPHTCWLCHTGHPSRLCCLGRRL